MTAQGLSERTITERVGFMERLGDPRAITKHDSLELLGSERLSNASRVTYMNHLRSFYRWAVEQELLPVDLTDKLPSPRAHRGYPKPITDREARLLLATPMRKRTRAMVMLGLYQGLRIHETVKLRGEDVDVLNMTLTVNGKGGVVARLPLSEGIAALAVTMPRRGWWFPNAERTGHIKANSASDTVSKAMRRAGVRASSHALRHWFATTMLARGANLRTVQELLRHSNLASTAIYTRVDDSQRRAAIDSLAA